MGITLTVISSSSSGNAYVIQSEDEALLLEAGSSISTTKHALNFNTSKVNGCLITHAHGDHSKYARQYELAFPVFANSHVISMKGLSQAAEIKAGDRFDVGKFKIIAFEAFHDIPTLGFFINHPDMGNLVFLTDSFMCNHVFKDVNHVLIECNYSDEALLEAIELGVTNSAMRRRLMTTHMELQTVAKFLTSHDLTNVYNILLLHLSRYNSNRKQFIDVLTKATGKNIQIADAGLVIDLSNSPY